MATNKQPDHSNPLITTRAPDTAIGIQLHPLVLLTISDYITRHTSRRQPGAIVGAVIGQQNGRNFTLEHAYQLLVADANSDSLIVDHEFFEERLEQYKDVHKVPALDLVAVFALGGGSGPTAAHQELVHQVQKVTGNDSVMLLLFHPDLVEPLQGGRLPVTLYESVQETLDSGEAGVKFRELSFEVETGEAEMIGVDYVATGAGNATAVQQAPTSTSAATASSSKDKKTKAKGKGKGREEEESGETNGTATPSSDNHLSPEDEELIASLTAKANAIQMLNQRLKLLKKYLDAQAESSLTSADSSNPPPDDTNYTLLRSIRALLARLPLLSAPSSTSPLSQPQTSALEAQHTTSESDDVHLTNLLASLTRTVYESQILSNRFNEYSREAYSRERAPFPGAVGRTYSDDDAMLMGGSNGEAAASSGL